MESRAYHHKDLKNALINAALAVVERDGSEAVSLRELAAQVGVSRAAPYRHFADRDALLAAVAARGFEDLCAIYMAALAGSGTGRERLRAALVAYLDFARRRQGLHALMFKSDFLGRTPPPAVLSRRRTVPMSCSGKASEERSRAQAIPGSKHVLLR